MLNRMMLAAGLCAGLALPAQATELETMIAAERDAFRAEVRNYLIENPEVLMEAFAILEEREATAEAEASRMAIANSTGALFNSAFDYSGGNPDGDIVMVEFLDYRCSFCRRAHPEVAELVEGDGNIRIVVKEFPILGEQSTLASQFAIATRIALGDEAYAMMSDALMDFRGEITPSSLSMRAQELGFDPQAILAEVNNPIVGQTIDYNRALAQRLGISGTPSFVFEDQLVRGYVPLAGMQQLVADLRATAP